MKQSILVIFSLMLAFNYANAQLFSSGNNVIPGTNVGIGVNTPAVKLHIQNNVTAELLRMENTNPLARGSFRLSNDVALNYASFSKYGSTYPGGYPGVTTQYPYANMLAFGNNNGPCLFSASGNTGIALAKSGTTKLKFNVNFTSENVGIGGNALPVTNIHFNNSLAGDTIKITNNTTGHNAGDGLDIRNTGIAATIMNLENSTLEFGTNNVSRMKINSDGKIVMGTTPTPAGYKLFVEEGILTEKVKVAVKTSSEWSDYVFAKEYDLKPLSEVEAFINQNNHLPGVPSAQDVVDNGIDMAKMDAKLLEKIEELTLHLIEMDKKMKDLQKRLELAETK
jgi:hypothetical protein